MTGIAYRLSTMLVCIGLGVTLGSFFSKLKDQSLPSEIQTESLQQHFSVLEIGPIVAAGGNPSSSFRVVDLSNGSADVLIVVLRIDNNGELPFGVTVDETKLARMKLSSGEKIVVPLSRPMSGVEECEYFAEFLNRIER